MQSVSAPIGGSQLLLQTGFQKGCSERHISKPSVLRHCNAAIWWRFAHATRCSQQSSLQRVSPGVVRNAARKGRRSARTAKKTAKSSVAEISSTTDTAPVTISLQKVAEFGFQYAVVGGGAALGDWNPAQAAVLEWSEGHIWSKTLDLPTNATIEYKFILVNNNMEAVEWQPGENRSLATSAGASTVQGQWDEVRSDSEDSSSDALMSEDDVSDEEGASVDAKGKEQVSRGGGRTARKRARAKPSAEGSLAEADIAPAATPAIRAAADAAAKVSPSPASQKPSTPNPAPTQETSLGGGSKLALAGALVIIALSAAVLSTPGSAKLVERGDIKGAVSATLERLHPAVTDVAGSVNHHSTKILNSVSEKSGALTKVTGEGLGGLTKAAGDWHKAASETIGGLAKAKSDGAGALTQTAGDATAGNDSRERR